jgi:hypothetical protein
MNNPSQDGWDWPYILYVGRKWLGYTDDQLWSLTPRQFDSQLKVHLDVTKKMHGGTGSSPLPNVGDAGFIDQIPGW